LSLRTLFVVVAVFAIALGLFTIRRDRAKRQQIAVSKIQTLSGGGVVYDRAGDLSWINDGTSSTIYIREPSLPPPRPLAVPLSLQRWLGFDFFANVLEVGSWHFSGRDEDLALFQSIPKIQRIDFISAPHITDGGLPHLAKLKHLKYLRLGGSQISDAGVRKLKESLPNCEVECGAAS
jgi:hypothetical protein